MPNRHRQQHQHHKRKLGTKEENQSTKHYNSLSSQTSSSVPLSDTSSKTPSGNSKASPLLPPDKKLASPSTSSSRAVSTTRTSTASSASLASLGSNSTTSGRSGRSGRNFGALQNLPEARSESKVKFKPVRRTIPPRTTKKPASTSHWPKNDELTTNIDRCKQVFLEREEQPTISHPDRLLVTVGDLHGESKAFEKLIELVFDYVYELEKRYGYAIHIRWVLVGDLIRGGSEGQSGNLRILDLAIWLKALTVRGNHEDRLLHAGKIKVAKEKRLKPWKEDHTVQIRSFHYPDHNIRTPDSEELELWDLLSDEHIKFLMRTCTMVHIGQIGDRNYTVVHAGVDYLIQRQDGGVSMKDQEPLAVMNMKSRDTTRKTLSMSRGDKEAETFDKNVRSMWKWWAEDWWNHQSDMKFPTTILHGHDNKFLTKASPFSRNLDHGVNRRNAPAKNGKKQERPEGAGYLNAMLMFHGNSELRYIERDPYKAGEWRECRKFNKRPEHMFPRIVEYPEYEKDQSGKWRETDLSIQNRRMYPSIEFTPVYPKDGSKPDSLQGWYKDFFYGWVDY